MSPHLQEIAEQCKLYDGWFVREENIEKFAQTLIDQIRGEIICESYRAAHKNDDWENGFDAGLRQAVAIIEKRFESK
jgi:hypothetical protein